MSDTAIHALKHLLDSQLADEKYDDVSIADAMRFVDIDCWFGMDEQGRRTTMPVIERNHSSTWEHSVPSVVLVEMNGDRFMIRRINDFDFVSQESVKIMRARFLLISKAYYRRLNALSHSMRQEIVATMFNGSVWVPPEGSKLAIAMGML